MTQRNYSTFTQSGEFGDVYTATATYDTRHGSPWDRGSADAYYWRAMQPHFYKGASYQSEKVGEDQMTAEQVAAYKAGYNGQFDRKDWGE